jgi:hypothetical protein
MAIKTTGASIITSKSAISSGLVIVNRPEGYVINGNAKQTIGDGVYVSPDGTRMFITGDASVDRTYQFNLSTPYDITTAVYNSNLLHTTSGVGSDLYFKPDGTKMYLTSIATDRELDPSGINITKDGYYLYFIGDSQDYVWQYELGLLS